MKIVPIVVTSGSATCVPEWVLTNSTVLCYIDISHYSAFSCDMSGKGRMSGLDVIGLVWPIIWSAFRYWNLGCRSFSAFGMLLLSSNTSTPTKWSWARWWYSKCCLTTWCCGTICLWLLFLNMSALSSPYSGYCEQRSRYLYCWLKRFKWAPWLLSLNTSASARLLGRGYLMNAVAVFNVYLSLNASTLTSRRWCLS
jgi:hypothetical protein